MRHALVTIVAPIPAKDIAQAFESIKRLGNPAKKSIADKLNGHGVHFASLHAIPSTDPQSPTGHLLLEFSADGEDDAAIDRIVGHVGKELGSVFALAKDRGAGGLAAYLKARKLEIGHGWSGQAGLAFAGTPGMSVDRILKERDLADFVANELGDQKGEMRALERLEKVRNAVRADATHAWALATPASLPANPHTPTLRLVLLLLQSFVMTYLSPFVLLVIAIAAARLIYLLSNLGADGLTWMEALNAIRSSMMWLIMTTIIVAVIAIAGLAFLYLRLREKERTDWVDERAPRRDVLHQILERENLHAHNHMISVTVMKPGMTREITTRLAFWIISQLARLSFKAGRLGEIGTIHFARWVTLPGKRELVFLSNYGGSWESYLEDFITKAHNGLTAVWSNTTGFPRAENLFQKGATDGERFKRFARNSMAPTPFWYSAYPTLTTANIRTNASIRAGLAAAMTDEEAISWLSLFGSAARPEEKLESSQIQSLVFGGLGFKRYGRLMLVDLCGHTPSVRAWLKDIRAEIAYDDGRRLKRDAVVTLGLGPGALAKAGLPGESLASFPPAFLDGMTGPGRPRILGDIPNDPDAPWWWGLKDGQDAALLVYGDSDASADALVQKVAAITAGYEHTVARTIKLTTVPETRAERLEPFEFVDGVSQPVIRGTYRGMRGADPIHLVEPGEFILGYPDNRGNIPPGPTLRALDDPDNCLPIQCDRDGGFGSNVVNAPRDIGRNGTFLVIRQLEQETDAFWKYCAREAAQLKDRLGEPYEITPEFIGAKMIGRWKDGSSLARNPYLPFTDKRNPPQHQMMRAATNPAGKTGIPPSPAQQAQAAPPNPPAAQPSKGNPEDNDFLFGTEDPEGLRCPFGAHIRRANPRDSLDPGSSEQLAITNRHRIMRVGRRYVAESGQKEGLMFMCLNGDIERQFEFVQQTWLGSETFHGLAGERDPLAGNKEGCPNGFTIPSRDGPVRLAAMAQFVRSRGGGYFFLPGKRLLEFLSS